MILQANKKYIDTSSIAHLLICGEKNVDIITFQVDKLHHDIDLSNCDFILRAVNENQNLIDQNLEKSIEGDYINLQWTINEYFTAVSGKLLLEIRAVESDNLILKYVISPIYVKNSATGEGLPDLNTVEKALDDMQDLLEQAQDIAIKTPYINEDTLTWYVWDISTNQFVDSEVSASGVKGDKGDTGATGQDGSNGEDGQSAYELWISVGNTGTETDFLNSLKGEQGIQGLQGEQGIQGVQGLKGDTGSSGANGSNGISPTILVCENTDTSYKLQITDVNGTIETPNLKGADGSGATITVDSELSDTSENPLQNKVVSEQLGSLWYNKLQYIYWDTEGNSSTKVGTEDAPIDYGYFTNLSVNGVSFEDKLSSNIKGRIYFTIEDTTSFDTTGIVFVSNGTMCGEIEVNKQGQTHIGKSTNPIYAGNFTNLYGTNIYLGGTSLSTTLSSLQSQIGSINTILATLVTGV